MQNKLNTNIERIIAKIDNDFNPDNSDWIPRVGAWTIDAMNMLKIQASKVVTEGDYVFFIMLGASDNKLKEDDEIYQHFSVQNDIAINTIESFFNK